MDFLPERYSGQPPETLYTPEDDSSQAAYVAELFAHAQTIPANFPSYYFPSGEDAAFFANYCDSWDLRTNKVVESGRVPLFREDTIDPAFCRSVTKMCSAISNIHESHLDWYEVPDMKTHSFSKDPGLSRRWDLFFVAYMRQRRVFNAHFMRSLLSDGQNDTLTPFAQTIDTKQIPPSRPYQQAAATPDFLYNRTNWLTASLLNAMSLPPDKCDANMKRQAIELFARLADSDDLNDKQGTSRHVQTGVLASFSLTTLAESKGWLRLPWSMQQTSQELNSMRHPQWRQNAIVRHYLGTYTNKRPDGLAALLQERPKDYLQVLLLKLYSSYNSAGDLRDLVSTIQLTDPVKNIIFASDASFVTVFNQPSSRQQMADRQLGLNELLDQQPGATEDPETLRATIGRQALQIQALEGELAERNRAYAQLSEKHRQLLDDIHQRTYSEREVGNLSPLELLFDKHGMSLRVGVCACALFVKALRTKYQNHYGPGGPDDNPDKLLHYQQELDLILEIKGASSENNGLEG